MEQHKHLNPPSSDDRLIHQLYQTIRVFTKTLNNSTHDLGIYSSEWFVLNLVSKHGSLSQSEIVADLHIEPAAVSKTLSKMEKKGLIERSSREDRREKYVALTPLAQQLFPNLHEAVSAHRDKALAGISEEERQQLYKTIRRIFENVQT
jgi:MarR family transcriptional regulator for hemolysin